VSGELERSDEKMDADQSFHIYYLFFSCLRVHAIKPHATPWGISPATGGKPHGYSISKNILDCSTRPDILYAPQKTLKMPQSLSKVTKKITRKKGRATGLHEKSRDAAKLRKASAREERVHRVNATKARAEEGYGTFDVFPDNFLGTD
jgi:hypothetical protein